MIRPLRFCVVALAAIPISCWAENTGLSQSLANCVQTLLPGSAAELAHQAESVRGPYREKQPRFLSPQEERQKEKSWSGELPITKTNNQVFEYACHEGNYGMANSLRGARAKEADKK